MIFYIDSWIWLEYFFQDSKWEKAREVIAKMKKEKAAISTFVLTETRYRINRKSGVHLSNKFLQAVYSLPNLSILPLTSTAAVYAADLRTKYYSAKNQLSHGDCVHLATAILSGCKTFYTGDPDFSEIKEIEVEII